MLTIIKVDKVILNILTRLHLDVRFSVQTRFHSDYGQVWHLKIINADSAEPVYYYSPFLKTLHTYSLQIMTRSTVRTY